MSARGLGVRILLSLAFGVLLAAPASGFDFFDRRLQIHGFYESQIRAIARDFDRSDDFDISQLAHVLNLEIEAEVAPDGWGPFELISAFSRIEVRYDCVWTRGCLDVPSIDFAGDGSKKLPKRLQDGRRSGFVMNTPNGDRRRYRGEPPPLFGFRGKDLPQGSRAPFSVANTPNLFNFFLAPGPDQIFNTADDGGPFVFSRYFGRGECKFGSRSQVGYEDGIQVFDLGPLDPACFVKPNAAANDKPNPFRGEFDYFGNPFAPSAGTLAAGYTGGDLNPITGGVFSALGNRLTPDAGGVPSATLLGSFAADLPYRPAPKLPFDAPAKPWQAKGLWLPHPELARMLREGEIARFAGNFRQDELAWNHGATQQDEKELKELYVDLEMLEGRLWLRLGKQTIVWGKTELFRNQDQFNPQDLALSSLPSLEESRVGLWAARGVFSFYDVGPLQDLRVELGVNYDQFEAADLGRCGEPYSVTLVCSAYFGFLAHGLYGLGLVGVGDIPNPWESWKGIEVGARVEWRWDRFSFALTNFYGYRDFPYLERPFRFERNVDPVSGRPRRAGSRGSCITGSEPACLQGGDDALENHAVNQTVWAFSCAALIGLVERAPTDCANQLFNSKFHFITQEPAADPENDPIYAALLTNQFAGNAQSWLISQFAPGSPFAGWTFPYVNLNRDPCDGRASDCTTPFGGSPGNPRHSLGSFPGGWGPTGTLNETLTVQQQAMLGCGEFYGTDCERDGIDLLNAEASFMSQSLIGIEGTFGIWDITDDRVAQPGTEFFDGGPVATRWENDQLSILPGARGPGDAGYDPLLDGCPSVSADPDCALSNLGAGAATLWHPFAGRRPGLDGVYDFAPGSDDFFECADGTVTPLDSDGLRNEGCQRFRSEGAALSYNYSIVLAGLSLPPSASPDPPAIDEIDDTLDGNGNYPNMFRLDGCSLVRTWLCENHELFVRSLRMQRNIRRAGGNGKFGRRDFQWHEGAPLVIRYEKANVLGFSTDFAEDRFKSNWSFELTWVESVPFIDNDEFDGLTTVDTFNLTISVDRPTFVNFLNANRTLFINSQVFVQYVDGHQESFPAAGPWNFLATLAVTTGYFQDRLLPTMIFVYDKRSNSGAFLPEVTYRFTENFSASFGAALFSGRAELRDMAINPPASFSNRVGKHAYKATTENGLSAVRDRDELYLRIKYTF